MKSGVKTHIWTRYTSAFGFLDLARLDPCSSLAILVSSTIWPPCHPVDKVVGYIASSCPSDAELVGDPGWTRPGTTTVFSHRVPDRQPVITEGVHRIAEPFEHIAEAIHGHLEAPNGGPEVGTSLEGGRGEGDMQVDDMAQGDRAGVTQGTDQRDVGAAGSGRLVDRGECRQRLISSHLIDRRGVI